MMRLFLILYTLAATTLAGSFIVTVLTMNRVDGRSIIVAAILGALVALPVAWGVARRLSQQT